MARPGLAGHRKFRRLARSLGSPIIARGVLELLWDHCYESGEDYVGTVEDIEAIVGWTGEQGLLTRALVDAGAPDFGFIEPIISAIDGAQGEQETARYRVHDLWHHAPDYVRKRREREVQRLQKLDPAKAAARSDERRPSVRRTAPNGAEREDLDGDGRTPSPSPSPSPSQKDPSRVSPADVVALWNELVTAPIPKVTKLTPDRSSKINARLRSFPELSTWRTVISWLNAQDWCRASGTGDHPHWTASIDWLCKSDGNVQKWLEKAVTVIPRRGASTLKPDWHGHVPHCRNEQTCTARWLQEERERDAAAKAVAS